MFNFGIFDNDINRGLPSAYIIDPIILTKYPQALSHSFVERVSSDINGMLDPFRSLQDTLHVRRATPEHLADSSFVRQDQTLSRLSTMVNYWRGPPVRILLASDVGALHPDKICSYVAGIQLLVRTTGTPTCARRG
jgi:hypothetical protein